MLFRRGLSRNVIIEAGGIMGGIMVESWACSFKVESDNNIMINVDFSPLSYECQSMSVMYECHRAVVPLNSHARPAYPTKT